MTRTEAALKAIALELQRQQADLDIRQNLRRLTISVIYGHNGVVRAVEFSPLEHRELL